MAAKRLPRDYKPKRKQPGGFSGWLGMVCGLAVGLGVAAVIYLKDHRPDTPSATAAKTGKRKMGNTESPDTEASEAGAAGDPARSYDFYDRLPKFEVVVPEKDKDVKPDIRAV